MKTVLVAFSTDHLVLVAVARSIARRAGGDGLAVLCVSDGAMHQLRQVATPVDDAPNLVKAAAERLGADESGAVELFDCRAPRPRRSVLDAVIDPQLAQDLRRLVESTMGVGVQARILWLQAAEMGR